MWEAQLPLFGANGVMNLTNLFQHEIKYEMGYLEQKDGTYIMYGVFGENETNIRCFSICIGLFFCQAKGSLKFCHIDSFLASGAPH